MLYLSANGKSIEGKMVNTQNLTSDLRGKKGVYALVNLQNFKMYIGISLDLHRRIPEHIHKLNENKHKNKHLQFSYNKHNGNFVVLTLYVDDEIDFNELKEKEKYYISSFDAFNRKFGYNLTEGGDGTQGYSHSKEVRLKMSKIQTGRKVSDETRKLQSKAAKIRGISKVARLNSLETRTIPIVQITLNGEIVFWKSAKEAATHLNIDDAGIRNCCNKVTLASSYKNSHWFNRDEYDSGNYEFRSEEQSYRKFPIVQLDFEDTLVKEWESAKKASIEMDADRSSIGKCCKGTLKTHKGFKWMYKKDYEKLHSTKLVDCEL